MLTEMLRCSSPALDRMEASLRPYPGDALLARLLWLPLGESSPAEVWSYYTSRPRRYALEPTLLTLSRYRFACRCRGRLGECKHEGELELECLLASRTAPSERATCWLRATDVVLNPQHAAVVARFAPFTPPRKPEGARAFAHSASEAASSRSAPSRNLRRPRQTLTCSRR